MATRGEGIGAVVDAIEGHRAYLQESGSLEQRERDRIGRELRMILQNMALDLVRERVPEEQRLRFVDQIQARAIDPYTAAEQLLGDALGVVVPTSSP